MSKSVFVIQNLKTMVKTTVDGDGWRTLQSKGYADRFVIIEERVLDEGPQTTYMPTELQKAVLSVVENEGKTTPGAGSQHS